MDHFLLISSALMVGACAGLLGGLLGIGGGVIIVPALIILLDANALFPAASVTLVAVATSLACVLGTSVAAARAQIRAGKVQRQVVLRWAPALVVGALLSAQIAQRLPLTTMRLLIGGFLILVAIVMLTSWKPDPRRPPPGLPLTTGLGIAGGIISGIAGIGGGNVIVPTLVYFNTPIHNATANSSTLGVPIAAAGVIGYLWAGLSVAQPVAPGVDWLLGYIYVPAAVLIVIMAMLCAPIGVRLAHRINPLPLRRLFGALLILVAGRMIYSAVSS